MKSWLKSFGLWLWDKKMYWMPFVGGVAVGGWLF